MRQRKRGWKDPASRRRKWRPSHRHMMPYTPRRQVCHAEEQPHYEQRTTDPATRAPRQEPLTWARPSGGDWSKGRGGKEHAPAKVCALYRLKRAHVTYSHTLCHAVPSMPSLCMSPILGDRAPMTIIRQPAACRDDEEHSPINAGEMHLITNTRTHPIPRADERESTGHHDELPGGSAVTEVHPPTMTLIVAHQPTADQAGQEHRPTTTDEMHLVTGIQCRPIPMGFAADQLPCLTAVTNAQRHSIPLSRWDICEASCITFTCRPVLLLARGRRGARRHWRGLTSPPVATRYHARRIEEIHRLAPHHVGLEAWLHDPTQDGDVESNPGQESPQQSPNMSNPGRLSFVLTPIKRLFGGAPTPEPQEGPSETQGTPPPDPPANEA